MLTTEVIAPDLRSLSLDDLGEMYGGADNDTCAAILAECERRARADKARDKRRAVSAEWYDAMFAQYMQAEDTCRGNLLSVAGIADPVSLWRGAEKWAQRMASEELRNFWDDHGARLSLAEYKRQQAMARRAARDERDLAAMDAEPEPEVTWERVPGGAVRPASVQVGSLTVSAWTGMDRAGTVTLHPSRDRAERWLSPAPGPVPAPAPRPAVAAGAIGRYTGALDILTARALAARARITNGG